MSMIRKYGLPIYLLMGVLLSAYYLPSRQATPPQPYTDLVSPPMLLADDHHIGLVGYGPQEQIYYTDDGSRPDRNSPRYTLELPRRDIARNDHLLRYQLSPITLPPDRRHFPVEARIIRATSFMPKTGLSKPALYTIFDRLETVHFPILSVAVQESDFFDPYDGLFVMGRDHWNERPDKVNTPWWEWPANYQERGVSSRRRGALEWLTPQGNRIESNNVFVRVQGNATRAFPQKSLRIEEDLYFGSALTDPFNRSATVESFLVRNSGNDWGHTMFGGAYMQTMCQGLKVETQHSQPVHLLINGVYWGIYNVRTRFDKPYLKRVQGIDRRVALFETGGEQVFGNKKDRKSYKKLLKALRSDDPLTEKFDYLNEKCDLSGFYDYIIAETFFANMDWPHNNVKCYRVGKGDQWHWLIHDMDYGCGYVGADQYKENMFRRLQKGKGLEAELFQFVVSYEPTKQAFLERYHEVLGQMFTPVRLLSHFDAMANLYERDMAYQLSRWRKPASMDEWSTEVNTRRQFLQKRGAIVEQQLEAL